jgi:hypothetical protein
MHGLDRNFVPREFNRRRTWRRSTQHIGKILTDPTAAPHYCLVTEASDGGVRVRIYIAPDFETPTVFALQFENMTAKYKVIWRDGQFLGAELASEKTSVSP